MLGFMAYVYVKCMTTINKDRRGEKKVLTLYVRWHRTVDCDKSLNTRATTRKNEINKNI